MDRCTFSQATKLLVALCLVPLATSADSVVVSDPAVAEPVVMVDGQDADCLNDQFFRSASPVNIGNFQATADCPGEIYVASPDRGMKVLENPSLDAGNNVVNVTLGDPLSVPMHFWMVWPETPGDRNATEALFEYQVLEANFAYNQSMTGIQFEDPSFEWIEGGPNHDDIVEAVDALFRGELSGADVAEVLTQVAPPNIGSLNVYVVNVPEIVGFHIRNSDGSSTGLIVLGALSTNSTLAHEIGHAFSLGHVNFEGSEPVTKQYGAYCIAYGHYDYLEGDCDYHAQNIMRAGIDGPRDKFSFGQAVRMNVNDKSFINTTTPSIRPTSEPRRTCPDYIFDSSCPYLGAHYE